MIRSRQARAVGSGHAQAWVVAAVAGALVLEAASLLQRTLRPMLEARRYVTDIRDATDGAARDMQALAGLEGTRQLSGELSRRLDGPL